MILFAKNIQELYRSLCTRYFLARGTILRDHGGAIMLLFGIFMISAGMYKIATNTEVQIKEAEIIAQYQAQLNN